MLARPRKVQDKKLTALQRVQRALKKVVSPFSKDSKKRAQSHVSGKILSLRTGRAKKAAFFRQKNAKGGGLLATIGFGPDAAWYLRFFEFTGSKTRVAGRGNTIDRRTGVRRKVRALQIPVGGKFIYRKKAKGFPPQPVLFPAVQIELDRHEEKIADEMERFLLDEIPRFL